MHIAEAIIQSQVSRKLGVKGVLSYLICILSLSYPYLILSYLIPILSSMFFFQAEISELRLQVESTPLQVLTHNLLDNLISSYLILSTMFFSRLRSVNSGSKWNPRRSRCLHRISWMRRTTRSIA